MKYLASFILAASSVFCAGLFAQENSPDTAPAPVSPVSPASAPAAPVGAPLAPVPPLQPGPLSRAEMAANNWLAIVDAGDYPLSWQQAASLLQTAVTQPKWESSLQTGRLPLGAVKSRQLKTANFSRTLAGAPDGEYVLISYETQFEFKAQAIETLTTMKDRDNWKVAGYFIK